MCGYYTMINFTNGFSNDIFELHIKKFENSIFSFHLGSNNEEKLHAYVLRLEFIPKEQGY